MSMEFWAVFRENAFRLKRLQLREPRPQEPVVSKAIDFKEGEFHELSPFHQVDKADQLPLNESKIIMTDLLLYYHKKYGAPHATCAADQRFLECAQILDPELHEDMGGD